MTKKQFIYYTIIGLLGVGIIVLLWTMYFSKTSESPTATSTPTIEQLVSALNSQINEIAKIERFMNEEFPDKVADWNRKIQEGKVK